MLVEFGVEDFHAYKLYQHGQIAILYYRLDPDPESLAFLDVANASRLKPKEGETILQRVMEKSDSMLEDGSKLLAIEKLLRGNAQKESLEKVLGREGNPKARKALENIVNVLGHNNILEQSHALIAVIAPISAIMNMQDERFVSSQERSTRYVEFNELYIPESLHNDSEALRIYKEAAAMLDNAYNMAMKELTEKLKMLYVQKEHREPESSYMETIIVPSARDLCRGLVPLAKQSIVYFSANAKSLESITRKMLASEDPTSNLVGMGLAQVIRENMPSFSKHLYPTDFDKLYFKSIKRFNLSNNAPIVRDFESERVELLGLAKEEQILEGIAKFAGIERENALQYIEEISSKRSGKYDTLNSTLLGIGSLLFDIEISIGSLRDLERHRDAIKNYWIDDSTCYLPRELIESSSFDFVKSAIENAAMARRKLSEMGYTGEARLLVPLATGARLLMHMGLGEALYIVENRSTNEAHPEYRG
ncbi:MAG: FAD-dependent thymidylate synthase, partial [Candidatus Micrarchaeia archaeon]